MKILKTKNILVFRIEYEVPPTMNSFTANVAAMSHEEAVNHVKGIMGQNIFISSSGLVCPLHDISYKTRALLLEEFDGSSKKKDDVKVDSTEQPTVESEKPAKLFHSGRGRKPKVKE